MSGCCSFFGDDEASGGYRRSNGRQPVRISGGDSDDDGAISVGRSMARTSGMRAFGGSRSRGRSTTKDAIVVELMPNEYYRRLQGVVMFVCGDCDCPIPHVGLRAVRNHGPGGYDEFDDAELIDKELPPGAAFAFDVDEPPIKQGLVVERVTDAAGIVVEEIATPRFSFVFTVKPLCGDCCKYVYFHLRFQQDAIDTKETGSFVIPLCIRVAPGHVAVAQVDSCLTPFLCFDGTSYVNRYPLCRFVRKRLGLDDTQTTGAFRDNCVYAQDFIGRFTASDYHAPASADALDGGGSHSFCVIARIVGDAPLRLQSPAPVSVPSSMCPVCDNGIYTSDTGVCDVCFGGVNRAVAARGAHDPDAELHGVTTMMTALTRIMSVPDATLVHSIMPSCFAPGATMHSVVNMSPLYHGWDARRELCAAFRASVALVRDELVQAYADNVPSVFGSTRETYIFNATVFAVVDAVRRVVRARHPFAYEVGSASFLSNYKTRHGLGPQAFEYDEGLPGSLASCWKLSAALVYWLVYGLKYLAQMSKSVRRCAACLRGDRASAKSVDRRAQRAMKGATPKIGSSARRKKTRKRSAADGGAYGRIDHGDEAPRSVSDHIGVGVLPGYWDDAVCSDDLCLVRKMYAAARLVTVTHGVLSQVTCNIIDIQSGRTGMHAAVAIATAGSATASAGGTTYHFIEMNPEYGINGRGSRTSLLPIVRYTYSPDLAGREIRMDAYYQMGKRIVDVEREYAVISHSTVLPPGEASQLPQTWSGTANRPLYIIRSRA